MLSVATGLLVGAVTGTGLVVTGVFPERPEPRLTLVSCYDNGVAIGTVGAGQSLLVTARSADGTWLELYLGLPEADRGWAPASAVRFSAAIDNLPVAECVGYIPPASGTPTPPPPTIEPTIPPSAEPSLIATVEPSVAPSPSPSASATPTPRVTPTPRPTAKPTATPLPPPPTPTPDLAGPSLSGFSISYPNALNGSYFLQAGNCGAHYAVVHVTATDSSGLMWVRLSYTPTGLGTSVVTMNPIGGDVYEAVVTPTGAWLGGEIDLSAQARDSHGNTSPSLLFGIPDNPNDDPSLFWEPICIT